MAFRPPEVGVRFTAENDEFSQAVKAMVAQMRDLRKEQREAKKSSDRFEVSQAKLEKSIRRTALRIVALVGGFELMRRSTRFIVGTAKEFEQLEARLISVTGSTEAAASAFELITDFARTTPFEIQNLVEAFTQLSAAGLTPTRDQLRDLGNFAAATGRDITELVSAIVKAGAGNSRELQKFFVQTRTEGEKLRVTFRGATAEIDRNFESVLDHFAELGRTNFGDAMERQMGTLSGALSNLQDSASIFANTVGERGLTAELTELVRVLDDTVGSSDELAEILGGALASAVRTAGNNLVFLIQHAEEALIILQGLGGAAVAGGLVRLVPRLAAALVAGRALGAALVGLLGGPAGAIITLSSAVLLPLIINLNKATNEAEGLVNVIRSFRTVSARETPLGIATQIERSTALIDALQEKIDDLQGRRRATGGLMSEDVVDPAAAEEAEKLQGELAGLEEHRRNLVLALDEQARAQREANEAEQQALSEEQIKRILAITSGLQGEVDALRLTERELLAKKLAEAGAGEATTEHALALFDQAAALREQEEGLKALRVQLERLPEIEQALLDAQGDTVGALKLQLQREYGDLIRALLSQADHDGVRLVQNLINTRLARARLQELEQEFGTARESLSVELERIELEHQSGAITAAEAQDKIRAAYQRQIDVLNELLPTLRAMAEATGDPAAIARVQALENELTRLGLTVGRIEGDVVNFGARAREAIEGDLISFLSDGINEAENLGAAFQELASSIIRSMQRIAAEIAARAVLRAVFPVPEFAEGGEVHGGQGFAAGGPVPGPGGPTSDTVPAMLSPGEYVVRAAAVKRVGVRTLEAINQGMQTPRFVRHGAQYFEHGGLVEESPRRRAATASDARGAESSSRPDITINVHSNQDPHMIARHVMEELVESVDHSSTLRSIFSR